MVACQFQQHAYSIIDQHHHLPVIMYCTHTLTYTGGASLAFAFAFASAGANQVGNIIPYLPNDAYPPLGLPYNWRDGSSTQVAASATAGAATSTNGEPDCFT
jgi:hypothetical protein